MLLLLLVENREQIQDSTEIKWEESAENYMYVQYIRKPLNLSSSFLTLNTVGGREVCLSVMKYIKTNLDT